MVEIVLDNRANLAIANGDAVVKLAPTDVAELLAFLESVAWRGFVQRVEARGINAVLPNPIHPEGVRT